MRRLALRKETLTELRADELTAVVGADAAATISVCISDMLRTCDSLLRPCITYTCTR